MGKCSLSDDLMTTVWIQHQLNFNHLAVYANGMCSSKLLKLQTFNDLFTEVQNKCSSLAAPAPLCCPPSLRIPGETSQNMDQYLYLMRHLSESKHQKGNLWPHSICQHCLWMIEVKIMWKLKSQIWKKILSTGQQWSMPYYVFVKPGICTTNIPIHQHCLFTSFWIHQGNYGINVRVLSLASIWRIAILQRIAICTLISTLDNPLHSDTTTEIGTAFWTLTDEDYQALREERIQEYAQRFLEEM